MRRSSMMLTRDGEPLLCPVSFDDAAMALARRGGTAVEICSTMVVWAIEAAEKAAYWAEQEDKRNAETEREAAEEAAREASEVEPQPNEDR